MQYATFKDATGRWFAAPSPEGKLSKEQARAAAKALNAQAAKIRR